MQSKSSVQLGKIGDAKKQAAMERKNSEKWKRLLNLVSRTNLVRKLSELRLSDEQPDNVSKIKEELTERKMCIEKDLESLQCQLREPLVQCVIGHGDHIEENIESSGDFEIKTEHSSGVIKTCVTHSDSGTLEIVTLIEEPDEAVEKTPQPNALPQSLSVQTVERGRTTNASSPDEFPTTKEVVKNVYDAVTKMLQKFNDNVMYALDQINKNILKAIDSLNQNVKSVLTVTIRDEIRSVMTQNLSDQLSVSKKVERLGTSKHAESGDGGLVTVRQRRSLIVSLNPTVVSIEPQTSTQKPDVYLQLETFSNGYPPISTNSLLMSSTSSLTVITEDVTECELRYCSEVVDPSVDEVKQKPKAIENIPSEKSCMECCDGFCVPMCPNNTDECSYSATSTSSAASDALTENVSHFDTVVGEEPLVIVKSEHKAKTSKHSRRTKETNSVSSSSSSTITLRRSKKLRKKKRSSHNLNCKCFDCVYTAYCQGGRNHKAVQKIYENHSQGITQNFDIRRRDLANFQEQINKTRRTLEENQRIKTAQRSTFQDSLTGLQQALTSLKGRLKLTEAKAKTITSKSPVEKKSANPPCSKRTDPLKSKQTSLSNERERKTKDKEELTDQEYLCVRNCERQLENFLLAKRAAVDSAQPSATISRKPFPKGFLKKNKPKQAAEKKPKKTRTNLQSNRARVSESVVENDERGYRFKITVVD